MATPSLDPLFSQQINHPQLGAAVAFAWHGGHDLGTLILTEYVSHDLDRSRDTDLETWVGLAVLDDSIIARHEFLE